MTLFFLLDFIIKTYTTYGIAKAIQGPYMWPIIGAINFFLSPQGKFLIFKLFYAIHLNGASILQKKRLRFQRDFVENSKMVLSIGHLDFSSIICIQPIRLRFYSAQIHFKEINSNIFFFDFLESGNKSKKHRKKFFI